VGEIKEFIASMLNMIINRRRETAPHGKQANHSTLLGFLGIFKKQFHRGFLGF
jgi:hypothetical protein